MNEILQIKNLHKNFQKGKVKVLKNLNLSLHKQSALCITGGSGVGKSTFLHILGALDRPSSGEIFYYKKNLSQKSDKELSLWRREKVGFIFQFHYLLTEFTALENIMIAGQINKKPFKWTQQRAEYLCELTGIAERKNHFPSELSGGEQQRTAIARALMNQPEIILADEPTGNLDAKNTERILEIFMDLRVKFGITIVSASHDPLFAKTFPKVLKMKDGRLFS